MEAVQNLAAHKKFSRKMNYDQLAKLMQEDDDEDFDPNKLQRLSSVAPSSQQNGRRDPDSGRAYGTSMLTLRVLRI
jgi:hypothetical protein